MVGEIQSPYRASLRKQAHRESPPAPAFTEVGYADGLYHPRGVTALCDRTARTAAHWAVRAVHAGERRNRTSGHLGQPTCTGCERHGQPFPGDTYTVRTWSGGTHLYFLAPEGEPLRNIAGDSARGLGWKVDTRAWGGLVVGAGSTFAGQPYEIANNVPVACLPDWLAELLRPAPLPPQTPITVALTGQGRRTAFLRSAINGEVQRVTGSGPHEHNNCLYLAAVALGQLVTGGELSEADVTGWLLTAALQVGQGEREARRTIASGLRAGARRPRTVAA